MAYFAPYIDDSGLHIPTYVDIRDNLAEQYKKIFGADIYLENDSQDYQMISAYALKLHDTMLMLQIIYNNHSPKTALGTALSSLVKLNGIKRKGATNSTCVLVITGAVGTIIPAGVAEDLSGNLWDLPTNFEITASPITVTATCREEGAVNAEIGSISQIFTPQAGWYTVNNEVLPVLGREVETDLELRARQSISVRYPAQNMVDATIAGIASVEGVTRYKVYDNDSSVTDKNGIPGHSIGAVVEGGLDYDIAEQIYLRKGPGGGTYGDIEIDFTNSDGNLLPIRFSRPVYLPINVTVKIRKDSGYSSQIPKQIEEVIKAYISALNIGDDVTLTGILTAIASLVEEPTRPPFRIAGLTVGTGFNTQEQADFEMPWNAAPEVGAVAAYEVL